MESTTAAAFDRGVTQGLALPVEAKGIIALFVFAFVGWAVGRCLRAIFRHPTRPRHFDGRG